MENLYKKFGAFVRRVPIFLKSGPKPPDYSCDTGQQVRPGSRQGRGRLKSYGDANPHTPQVCGGLCFYQ